MKLLSLIVSVLFFVNNGHCTVTEINYLEEIEKHIPKLTSEDLVLFDIDYTLIEPQNPVLQMGVIKRNKRKFQNEMAKFTYAEKLLIPVLMVTHSSCQLTDPYAPELIKKLQLSGATVLGLTAADTSSIPDVGFLPPQRKELLEYLGIRFSAPKVENITFRQFASYRGSYPVYYDGILYSNTIPSKGAVLKKFLEYSQQHPKLVVFVDDTLDNLLSVENELKYLGIPFIGFHYRASHKDVPDVSDEEWETTWEELRQRVASVKDRVYIMAH
ncbi:MAG: DUF2608 domain-containing protein [Parachlamydiaceae bacterium]